MAPEAILKLALVKSAEVSRSISIITGQTSPSTTTCLERIVTTLQGATTIIPWNEMETWICRAEYTLSAFPALYIHFKAFVTLHNDMIFQQTHRNNDEVRRERQRVNRQLMGTDMKAPGSSQKLWKTYKVHLVKLSHPTFLKILQCRTNRH